MVFLEEYKDGYKLIDLERFLELTGLENKTKYTNNKEITDGTTTNSGFIPKVTSKGVVLKEVDFETVSVVSSRVDFVLGFRGVCSFLPINDDLGLFTLFTGGFNLKIYDEEDNFKFKLYAPNTDSIGIKPPYIIKVDDKVRVNIGLVGSSLKARFRGLPHDESNYLTIFNYNSVKDFPVCYYDFSTKEKYKAKIKEVIDYNASCLTGCSGVGVRVLAVIPLNTSGKASLAALTDYLDRKNKVNKENESIVLHTDKEQSSKKEEINVEDVVNNFFT